MRASGSDWPWTKDPVLQSYRFCNIFREDDRTTRYFRETVREPLRDDPLVMIATLGWRWFNRIETCGSAKWWTLVGWDRALAERDFRPIYESGVPLVTGAYLIKTPNGMDKLTGILHCMDQAQGWMRKFHPWDGRPFADTLEEAHTCLTEIPYLGRFMAYEIVTDLRHTHLLEGAEDILTWASAGPGACRGVSRVLYGRPDAVAYGPASGQQTALSVMRELLAASRERWDWPDRPWEMREVEHTLCEYDKYRRAQEGGTLKRRYQPS